MLPFKTIYGPPYVYIRFIGRPSLSVDHHYLRGNIKWPMDNRVCKKDCCHFVAGLRDALVKAMSCFISKKLPCGKTAEYAVVHAYKK